MEYPFKPKSTSHIEQGHFWAVPIGDGNYSCGVVLALVSNENKRDPRMFLAGLLDWAGNSLPQSNQLEGCAVLDKGFAHIKTITETGGEILGQVVREFGYPKIIETTDTISTWGYNFVTKKAVKRYGCS